MIGKIDGDSLQNFNSLNPPSLTIDTPVRILAEVHRSRSHLRSLTMAAEGTVRVQFTNKIGAPQNYFEFFLQWLEVWQVFSLWTALFKEWATSNTSTCVGLIPILESVQWLGMSSRQPKETRLGKKEWTRTEKNSWREKIFWPVLMSHHDNKSVYHQNKHDILGDSYRTPHLKGSFLYSI